LWYDRFRERTRTSLRRRGGGATETGDGRERTRAARRVAAAAESPGPADARGGRRRLGGPDDGREPLPGDGHPRGSEPRLRPEPPAVHGRPAGRQGEPEDRDELLHDQAAPRPHHALPPAPPTALP